MFRALPLACLFIAVCLGQIAAQQPTPEQRDAIRAACRSDFMSRCSGVQPGGKEALDCLMRNDARLSAPCKTAVSAVAPKPTAPAAAAPAPPAAPVAAAPSATQPPEAAQSAAAQPQEDQLKAIQQACTLNDFVSHCSWIQPSSPEVLLCLQANAVQLSPACQTAVGTLPPAAPPAAIATAPAAAPAVAPEAPPAKPAPRPAAVPAKTPQTVARPSPPPAPAAAVPRQPTPEQTAAIRAACRNDFMSRCSGVQPGGAEALQCLERNAAQLSPPCQSAVAAIGKGAPAAASTAAAAAPAAPAVAPLAPMPPMPIRVELAILRACGADQRTLCAGIPPGGGRIIGCLAQNASSLSPQCYGAIAEARR
jgi:hypothetical protein